jgi:NAD-specific glutamate dehydrogenase
LLLDLLEFRAKLVVAIINSNLQVTPERVIEAWADNKSSELNRVKRVIAELKAAGRLSIDKLFFANRQLASLLN